MRLLVVLILTAITTFMSACTCNPILYKPTSDPASTILSLKMPETIETLSSFPRDKTYVENGMNFSSGKNQPDGIKEMFKIFKGLDESNYIGTDYYFKLCYNEAAAVRGYEFAKSASSQLIPVFHEVKSEKWAYYLTYINQLRSDPEGFCSHMSYYISRITFRLSNLVVRVEARDKIKNSDLLVSSIEYLANLLRSELNTSKNQNEK